MEEKKNIENFNRELLAKYLCNEVSSREKLDVESWLNQSEKNQDEMKEYRQTLEKVDAFYKAKSFNSKAAWNNVHSKIKAPQSAIIQRKKVRKEAISRFYKYAAIIVVAILLGSVGYYIGFKNQMPFVFNEIVSNEKQVINEFVLPDGTLVTLNNNSKLTFPNKFRGNFREVTLVGEAFFDVKPNPEKPFIIRAGNAQVKVLGTSFNVCAYPETETVEVIVKTGKVELIQTVSDVQTTQNNVFLNPGDKGVFFNKSGNLEKSLNINPNFLSWKTHDLIFNEIQLSEVIQCLEKVYNIETELVEPELDSLLLTAHFDKKPIEFVLNVIQLTFNLELSEENEHFILSSRNNE